MVSAFAGFDLTRMEVGVDVAVHVEKLMGPTFYLHSTMSLRDGLLSRPFLEQRTKLQTRVMSSMSWKSKPRFKFHSVWVQKWIWS